MIYSSLSLFSLNLTSIRGVLFPSWYFWMDPPFLLFAYCRVFVSCTRERCSSRLVRHPACIYSPTWYHGQRWIIHWGGGGCSSTAWSIFEFVPSKALLEESSPYRYTVYKHNDLVWYSSPGLLPIPFSFSFCSIRKYFLNYFFCFAPACYHGRPLYCSVWK